MAKQTGLGDRLFVDGLNVSGDVTAIDTLGGGLEPLDATGIDKSAFERLGGLRDGRAEFTCWWNPGEEADAAHAALSTLPRSDRVLTYCRGTSLGGSAAGMVFKQANYDGTRDSEGSFTLAVQALANGTGLEWGVQGTAGIRTDTAATNGSSVDHGAATEFGLTAYLHVFAFTGTSVTVKLQESSDDGAADSWADVVGGGFTAATAVGAERIATATDLDVERYLRVVTTGTFSNAEFAVVIVRHETAVE